MSPRRLVRAGLAAALCLVSVLAATPALADTSAYTFEAGASGWVQSPSLEPTSTACATSSSYSHGGNTSILPAGANTGVSGCQSPAVAVAVGATVTTSGWARFASATTLKTGMCFRFEDSSGSQVSRTCTATSAPGTAFTQYSLSALVPSGAATVRSVVLGSATSTTGAYWDDVVLDGYGAASATPTPTPTPTPTSTPTPTATATATPTATPTPTPTPTVTASPSPTASPSAAAVAGGTIQTGDTSLVSSDLTTSTPVILLTAALTGSLLVTAWSFAKRVIHS